MTREGNNRDETIEAIVQTTIHLNHAGTPPLLEVAKLQSCLQYVYTYQDWPDAQALRTFLTQGPWPHCFFDAEVKRRSHG